MWAREVEQTLRHLGAELEGGLEGLAACEAGRRHCHVRLGIREKGLRVFDIIVGVRRGSLLMDRLYTLLGSAARSTPLRTLEKHRAMR